MLRAWATKVSHGGCTKTKVGDTWYGVLED